MSVLSDEGYPDHGSDLWVGGQGGVWGEVCGT